MEVQCLKLKDENQSVSEEQQFAILEPNTILALRLGKIVGG